MRRMVFALVMSAALPCAFEARAQSSDAAFAETLYRQGRALMDERRYDEACAKFAESHRLDPATGTLLNLAACNEARGKLATAWTQYNDALLAARRDQREDRVNFARERISEVEPKLSRLTVAVAPGAEVEGLEVRLDGALLGPAARGVPAPIDPGKHTISANAVGKKPWSREVVIGAEADQKTVTVPLLEDAPAPKAAPVGAPPTSSRPGEPDRIETERPVPASVYVAGGATLLLAIGAGITGAVYLDDKATYNGLNDDPNASPGAREDARDDARLWGTANGVLLAGTVIGAALTGYLYFTRPEIQTRRARVSPWVGADGGGVLLEAPLF